MLKIALPNKGSLSEEALALVKEAGYKAKREGKELSVIDQSNDIEFLFLRPRDIAIYVGGGIVDIGITGRDLLLDSEAPAVELLPLGFGKSRFCYAVPKGSSLTPEGLDGCRIATSYPNIVKQDRQAHGQKVKIVKLDGAVEISIQLGVADAIADVVESGATMRQAGLVTTGEPVLQSEAVLIARDKSLENGPQVHSFLQRIKGILLARNYVMIEYDIPRDKLSEACRITPGIESPTVAPLSKADWFAVKSMVKRQDVNRIIDSLEACGAKGIIVMDIRTCRI